MTTGNAWKHTPARQARLQASMQNPEWVRRREMYRKAKSQAKKTQIAHWNIAWNQAGRPDGFPDLPEWLALVAEKAGKFSPVSPSPTSANDPGLLI
jgi:hypothetical protein